MAGLYIVRRGRYPGAGTVVIEAPEYGDVLPVWTDRERCEFYIRAVLDPTSCWSSGGEDGEAILRREAERNHKLIAVVFDPEPFPAEDLLSTPLGEALEIVS